MRIRHTKHTYTIKNFMHSYVHVAYVFSLRLKHIIRMYFKGLQNTYFNCVKMHNPNSSYEHANQG